MPDLASRHHASTASLKEGSVSTEFDYGLARFISFRDAEACGRVRSIPREEITRHANPDFRISVVDSGDAFYAAFATDLVDRIRQARDESRQFVAILPVGPMPQYQLAARTINDERPLALARAHVQHGRVRERGRADGTALVAGIVPAGDVGALPRPHPPELRPPEAQIHFPTTEQIGDYSARGSRTSAAPTSATAASAGAVTSRSGSRISGSSSKATWRRTSTPAPASSSCTR